MKKEGKYDLILDAAIEVMTEQGFEKAAVSQIVKRAGVAQGTFYLYFSSKSEIIPAIAERIFNEQMDEIQQLDESSSDFYDTLKIVIDVTFDITAKYKEVIIFCYSGIAFYHSFKRWEEIYKPYYDWVEERFKQSIENHAVSSTIPITSQVKMMINTIENTAETYFFSNSEHDERSIKQLKENVYQFLTRTITR
ncbi:TetR family transcriptional regulator [Bacillus shivajii]|uniref:TetR family transcriptional regulator n=1 Tax=Bacillus shivajii TaxID=1983719 RepID=UPI001CFBE94A|nr:TetR family transcriptional regulator [Bacillus shivajii]UCZ55138.1 TetR family transcriptional regulator [Bacillus shivajii]